jgi:PiT family inorganic phosphate transporter
MDIIIGAGVTIILALIFTFTNGFQDASAVAATFIASRSAQPAQGIVLVAAMNFCGAILGGSAVAFTISSLLTLEPGPELVYIILSAVSAAALWNITAWKFRVPSSSTHALIGGLVGAGVAAAGLESVNWGVKELFTSPHELEGLTLILVFLILSVILGLAAGYFMRRISGFTLRNARRSANRQIVRLNWIAAAIMSFLNGANDAQKQLGIIVLVLFAAGQVQAFDIPLWARILCAIMLTAGTLGGGWRIMATLGRRIFKIEPIHSFDSQVSSGATIAISNLVGAPISSTHIISSSIIGVGYAENPLKVQWSAGKDIIMAMILTIPVAMIISAIIYTLLKPFMGS